MLSVTTCNSGLLLLLLLVGVRLASCSDYIDNAKRLFIDLFDKPKYDKSIIPIEQSGQSVYVYLGVKFISILDCDEKNQVVTVYVWMQHVWKDYRLKWDAEEYGGITYLYVPANMTWLPDICIFNNAEGSYEVRPLTTKVQAFHDGRVVWVPPVIYQFFCNIDVEFFPLDVQQCRMEFSSWTYELQLLDLIQIRHYGNESFNNTRVNMAMDLSEYEDSVEFDVVEMDGLRQQYLFGDVAYVNITYYITLKRKPLYFVVNLILPTVAISFLGLLNFYLPVESGEKSTMCITIILALTMFFMAIDEMVPPNSVTVPLFAEYLMLTFSCISCSCIVTVVVLNFHCRKNEPPSPTMRYVFLYLLPKLLLMDKPDLDDLTLAEILAEGCKSASERRFGGKFSKVKMFDVQVRDSRRASWFVDSRITSSETPLPRPPEGFTNVVVQRKTQDSDRFDEHVENMPLRIDQLVQNAQHIKRLANVTKSGEETKLIQEEWKYVAMVVDRILLILFSAISSMGILIFMQAPSLSDQRPALNRDLYMKRFGNFSFRHRHAPTTTALPFITDSYY